MPLYRARISTSICCPPIKQKDPETNKQTNLIDDVERKQTQCIVFLHFPWSTKFVECALGHPREHVNERVQPVLLVLLRERNHLQTKRQKGSIKEPIHQKHLTWKKKERQRQFEIYWICNMYMHNFWENHLDEQSRTGYPCDENRIPAMKTGFLVMKTGSLQ